MFRYTLMAMDYHFILWLLVVILMILGLVGLIIPALPGSLFIFAGIWIGAGIDQYTRVPVWVVIVCAVLTVLAWAIDFVASLIGIKKAGASQWAVTGAAIGTLLGMLMGFVGVFVMPFIGAVIGQYLTDFKSDKALHVGWVSWLSMMIGIVLKIALSCIMIGLFIASYLL